jgi:hypothetical protein
MKLSCSDFSGSHHYDLLWELLPRSELIPNEHSKDFWDLARVKTRRIFYSDEKGVDILKTGSVFGCENDELGSSRAITIYNLVVKCSLDLNNQHSYFIGF